MTVMCINNSLVRSSSDLLVHSQVLVMCHSLEYQNFKLSKLILSAGFLPQKKLLSIYFCWAPQSSSWILTKQEHQEERNELKDLCIFFFFMGFSNLDHAVLCEHLLHLAAQGWQTKQERPDEYKRLRLLQSLSEYPCEAVSRRLGRDR
jgi:hypothetical protein